MPNIGVYHQTVEPNRFVAPINLDVYQKGLEHQEGIAKENLNILSSVYRELSNIPAYGVDATELHKQMDGLKNELLSSNLSNLSDPNSFSQINSIINKAKNNPRVAEIAKRGTIYSQELAMKQKAEEKGEHYTSPALDTLQEYYFNNNNFYENPQNVNLSTGWTSPQIHKLIGESLKNVPKVTKNVQVGGYWKPVESYDPDALQAVIQDVYNRDDVKKEINWRLEKETKGKDWTSVGMKDFENNYMLAQNALQINPTDQKALDFISTYSQLINNPDLLGKMAKNDYFKSQYDKEIQQNLAAYQYQSEGKMDADDFKLKAIDHQNKMQEDQFKLLAEGASQYNLTTGELQTLMSRGSITKDGQIVTIDNVADAGVTFKADAAYQKTLQQSEAKTKAKQNTLGALGDTKIPSTQSIVIGNTNYTKGEWDDITERAKNPKTAKWTESDKSALVDVIKTYPEYFGLPDDYSSLAGTDVIINKDGTLEIKNPWYTRNTAAADLSRFATAVNDAATKRNSNQSKTTTVNPTDTIGTSTAERMNKFIGK